ncbi:MAG: hypothetical protein A3B79_04635 [Deltaproteobacteria bacterium RIFCSPHIGHO2_02_FULL_50_15]|nr:MAG: hypothetical protein A3B79_04635 [Deltaproteobacteria bacterium RIFCSPHIGHO2_02_FULL_50_15]
MKKKFPLLPLFLLLSISIHLSLLLILFVKSPLTQRPATGGGGHIEIVGLRPTPLYSMIPKQDLVPEGTRVHEIPSPHQGMIESNGDRGLIGQKKGPRSGDDAGDGSGPDGESLLLAEIRARIDSVKRYPLRARTMKIKGTSEIQFRILANGSVDHLHIIQSSGSPLLDEEALATVKRAGPLPYYPKPLNLVIQFESEE